MLNFSIHTSTEVVFGRDIEGRIGPKLKEIGAHRVLVHFGGSSARSSGLLDRVEQSLSGAGLGFVELGGVEPNPKVSMARRGIELCKREGIDFILAVGGGSVIDSAKAIGMGVATGRDPWEFAASGTAPDKTLPVATVLTLAASGSETSNSCVLTNEETISLLRKTKEGDMAAREKLINGNLRLVLSVIQKFSNRGENVDDLFQVGCIGLIKAIDNFNTDLDVRFSTYGVPMIVGEIRRYLRDNSSMRVSRSMRDTAYKVLQAKEKFMAEHQREPTMEEIAKMLDLKREDVVFAMEAIMDPVSLYEPVYSDGGDPIYVMDQVKDAKNTDESWLEQIALKEAMAKLTEREKHILSLRFFEGKTQMEVSAEVGISQAQVSRLEKNAIRQIKKEL